MYIILTSKPGIYTASIQAGGTPVETYQYLFYGRCKAVFTLVQINAELKIDIVEDTPPHIRNVVSSKFLDHFDTLDAARAELNHLVHFGGLDAVLQPCEPSGAVA